MFMRAAAAAILALAVAGSAAAGPATDAFGKCLVQSSTGKDRLVLIHWMFSAMSADPDLASVSGVTEAQRATANVEAAHLFDRLVLVDCRQEAVAAIRQDGAADAMRAGFEVFGRAAAGEIMGNDAVQRQAMGLAKDIDLARWGELEKEAGK